METAQGMDEAPKIELSVTEMRMLGGFVITVSKLVRMRQVELDKKLYTPERVMALQQKMTAYEGQVIAYEARKTRFGSPKVK